MTHTIKRFYKGVSVTEAAEGGLSILLDSKPVRTPAGKPLVLPPAPPLADAVAAEWDAQTDHIRPWTMPLTQLAATALDRVGPERPVITQQLLGFAATDLLCYRVDFPHALRERQEQSWQPLLDWLAETLGARLDVTFGLTAIEQSADSLAAIARRLESYDVWTLTAAQSAAAAAGSTVLALGLAEGRLDGQQVFALAQLDETFQMEQWGEDYEAADRRRRLESDIAAAATLLALLSA